MQRTANIVPKERGTVYGVLLVASREDHERMLTLLLETGTMGAPYLPEAAVVETLDGRTCPTLVYTKLQGEVGDPSREYLDSIVRAAKRWGFPAPYVSRLENFLPS